MKTFLSWVAFAVVIYFVFFIIKQLIRFIFRRKGANNPIHDQLADAADDIASASRVAAAFSSAAAFFVAPAGLLAVGAALGIVQVPLIVRLVPFLLAFAVGAAALSALAKLYAKSRRNKK